MKIGYLMQAGAPKMLSHPFSGPAVHVREVCVELRRLGHQVRVVSQLDGMIHYSDDCRAFVPLPLSTPRIRGAVWLDRLSRVSLLDSLCFGAACWKLLQGFDVLYERMGWLGFGGALASGMLKLPLLVEVNGDHLWERGMYGRAPKGLARAAYIAATRRALSHASHIVASGPEWRARVIERFGIKPEEVTVVNNGSRLVELLRRQQLQSFSSAAEGNPVVIAYVGGFYPWQAVDLLLKVVKRLVQVNLPVRLVLIGSGFGERSARELALKLGLGEQTAFLGSLPPEEYAHKLAASDIGVAPYCGIAEFSGLKLLDYKAAGLAIVASGRNGEPNLIRDGVTGLIVKPCDEDELLGALITLISDGGLRRSFGRRVRIEAEKQHSWRHTAAAVSTIIKTTVQPAAVKAELL